MKTTEKWKNNMGTLKITKVRICTHFRSLKDVTETSTANLRILHFIHPQAFMQGNSKLCWGNKC